MELNSLVCLRVDVRIECINIYIKSSNNSDYLACGANKDLAIVGELGWFSPLSIRLLISGSGHDLTVCEIEPLIGLCEDSAEPAWDSLSPPLSLCLPPPQNK